MRSRLLVVKASSAPSSPAGRRVRRAAGTALSTPGRAAISARALGTASTAAPEKVMA